MPRRVTDLFRLDRFPSAAERGTASACPPRRGAAGKQFGTVRKLASDRWQARYIGPDGERYTAPETFETRSDAQDWLNLTRADIERNHWRDPDAGAVNFEKYALRWI